MVKLHSLSAGVRPPEAESHAAHERMMVNILG